MKQLWLGVYHFDSQAFTTSACDSFKELEADLDQPQVRQHIGAPRSFRDDTLRYSLVSFATELLEQMLVAVNRQLKRNASFDPGRVQGHLVASLDGIEAAASSTSCCWIPSTPRRRS